jgi:hypothetical protein
MNDVPDTDLLLADCKTIPRCCYFIPTSIWFSGEEIMLFGVGDISWDAHRAGGVQRSIPVAAGRMKLSD